jgi:hypothetical protein
MPRKSEPILRLLETTTLVEDYERLDGMTVERLGEIPHPKLLIYDTSSPYLGTYHILRETLQCCTSVLFPPSKHKHFSPLEQPEMLVEHIKAFLAQRHDVATDAPKGAGT